MSENSLPLDVAAALCGLGPSKEPPFDGSVRTFAVAKEFAVELHFNGSRILGLDDPASAMQAALKVNVDPPNLPVLIEGGHFLTKTSYDAEVIANYKASLPWWRRIFA